MDEKTIKINHTKDLIEKAINNYRKAIDKIEQSNDNEQSKEIVLKIEKEIDKLNKMRESLKSINETIEVDKRTLQKKNCYF